jgi:hypothetical protein
VVVPFRLAAGDAAPVQQTSTTCGSASLTVARMLADPDFAQWVRFGVEREAEPGAARDTRPVADRFAAYEQVVARRTAGLFGGGGRLQAPWPRALGTSPWGGRNELRFGAADAAARYAVTWFRLGGPPRLGRAFDDLTAHVAPRRPALLYIGSRWLPRHVVLVLAAPRGLQVYEPSIGRVVPLGREPFVSGRLRLAGWDTPWAAVRATAGDGRDL